MLEYVSRLGSVRTVQTSAVMVEDVCELMESTTIRAWARSVVQLSRGRILIWLVYIETISDFVTVIQLVFLGAQRPVRIWSI